MGQGLPPLNPFLRKPMENRHRSDPGSCSGSCCFIKRKTFLFFRIERTTTQTTTQTTTRASTDVGFTLFRAETSNECTSALLSITHRVWHCALVPIDVQDKGPSDALRQASAQGLELSLVDVPFRLQLDERRQANNPRHN